MTTTNKDLYGQKTTIQEIRVNIYADEIQPTEDKTTKELWFYIGILIENISLKPLEELIYHRFLGNFDETSKYFKKNNRVLHWKELNDAETKHICKRFFNYFFNKQKEKLFFYLLGINDSRLIQDLFGKKDKFNNKYNRFFRSALSYAIKIFFKKYDLIIVENVFHEIGQQKDHPYFPWHSIFKIKEKQVNKNERKIYFCNSEITFLPKDHRENKRSNFIQLCDCLMGATKDVFHGEIKEKKKKLNLLRNF